MLARWPGVITAGSSTHHISAFWDILPTLAELTNQAVPADVDGLSLLPTLRGDAGQARHQQLYWEYHDKGGMQAVLFADSNGAMVWKAVRSGANSRPDRPLELYHLGEDPLEQFDIATSHPDMVARAQALIDQERQRSPIDRWNFE